MSDSTQEPEEVDSASDASDKNESGSRRAFLGRVAALGIASSLAAAQSTTSTGTGGVRPYGDPAPKLSDAESERTLHRGFRRAVDRAYEDMTRLEGDPVARHEHVREVFENELKDFFA